MSRLLRPEDHQVTPFVDSSNRLDDMGTLKNIAADQGYLFFRRFLGEAVIEPVRSFARTRLASHGWVKDGLDGQTVIEAAPGATLKGRGWDDPDWMQFQQRFSGEPVFQALATNPKVTRVLEAVFGEPVWHATNNFCWLKLPGNPEHTTLPRQDEWYLPRCGHMWTMWVPLVDTPYDVGPLGVVPMSNKRDVEDHFTAFSGLQVEPEVEWVSGEVAAGDVVFFAARTIHCVWTNVSASMAHLSATIRYEPSAIGAASKLRIQAKL